jgi:hypothetical protein
MVNADGRCVEAGRLLSCFSSEAKSISAERLAILPSRMRLKVMPRNSKRLPAG